MFVWNAWDWIEHGLTSHQHSIGYMGDGFYRSKDPTNSIKVLICLGLAGKILCEMTYQLSWDITHLNS